jgi:hypothetical protein
VSKVIEKSVLFLILLASPVFGQIVEDTNITVNSSPGSFELTVLQSPEFDVTQVFGEVAVSGSTATLLLNNTALDEGSDWFVTNPGDLFTRDSIEAGQFNFLPITEPASGSLAVEVDESFFLGVNTGSSDDFFSGDSVPFDDIRQHFGWGEFLINQNGELQILDSAVAYDLGGIVIGTSTAIPEPSSGLLMLAGAAFLFLRRSRCNSIHRLSVSAAV